MPEPSIGNDFVKAPVARWRQLLLAWLVSGSTLLLTGLFWHASNRDLVRDADTRFANGSNSIVQAVQNRMQNYEQVLRGGVGLFHASGTVTRKEWHDFVLNAEIERHFPGIQNMAVSMPVPARSSILKRPTPGPMVVRPGSLAASHSNMTPLAT